MTARWRQAANAIAALARWNIAMRYGRGRFRALKWLLDPYAATGIYLLLVAFVLDRPGGAVGLSVACAIVPFQLVTATIVNALSAVHAHRWVITNMRFDRSLIPFASAVTETIGFAAALTLLPLMMAAYGVAPTAALLWLPVLLAVSFLLALAAAYPAALAGLWFPDARPLLHNLARASFFIAPGVVALDQVHGAANEWLRANPLTGLFESYRSVFLEGQSPAAWQLLLPCGAAALLLVLFVPLLRREEPQMAKLVE
jgi:ABC-type polysaccharide/polyol phosphate export permease